jgi:hypothetical protein
MQNLISHIASIYSQHDSSIARLLNEVVNEIDPSNIIEAPNKTPACKHLANIDSTQSELADMILQHSGLLHWRAVAGGKVSGPIADEMAAVELIGPTGMIHSDRAKVGFYLQGPGVFYPPHWHPAEELYYIAHGNSWWSVDDNDLAERRAKEFIHHQSMQPHTMETRNQALLAMWAWTGDMSLDGYTLGS